MAKLKIEVDDTTIQQKLAKLESAVEKPRMFQIIGASVAARIRLCFKLGVDPWGNPWPALKIRKGQPLVNRGILRRSITSKADSKGVTIGTNLKNDGVSYPAVHQFGATIKPKKQGGMLVFPGARGNLIFAKGVTIPRRAFMPIQKQGGPVVLPKSWADGVGRALKRYFKREIGGE